ncbi:MAG: hypothetical protein UY35_C0021G0010 [Candidatus Saccharibacteria bacterium GW2011_GWC2_48_9]|nr:MAG: hypothetical protein UY35_C0021G0010 [Candidatus Saccharibacteria bacterium GW2011_GWC2_48_9]
MFAPLLGDHETAPCLALVHDVPPPLELVDNLGHLALTLSRKSAELELLTLVESLHAFARSIDKAVGQQLPLLLCVQNGQQRRCRPARQLVGARACVM